jgi:hypothetical protein
LRNALIPVLTIIGLQFSFLLAGAIIIENVFFLPGLGRLIFPGDHPARPDRGGIRGDAAGLRGDRGDLPGRSRLCRRRPAAAARDETRILPRSFVLGLGAVLTALFVGAGAAVLRLDAARRRPA